jgi:hypothetical protein
MEIRKSSNLPARIGKGKIAAARICWNPRNPEAATILPPFSGTAIAADLIVGIWASTARNSGLVRFISARFDISLLRGDGF